MTMRTQHIVVTGGGSGIGRAIARLLISRGARVSLLGRSADKLQAVASELGTAGSGQVRCFACDVSREAQVQEVFATLARDGGAITGLVNNAGVNPSRTAIGDTSAADWEQTIAVNLTGAFHCVHAALPLFVNGGSIVNMASIAGLTALPERCAYMASKWGLVGLTKSLAIDYAARQIRVNCVCPGYVETPLVAGYLHQLPDPDRQAIVDAHLLGRLGAPEDIAHAVCFLLSDEAAWITGAVLPVDGGYTVGKML